MFNLDQIFAFHSQALKVREQRAELLANNLANVDTPNFHAKDIDFKTILSSLSGNGSSIARTNANHMPFEFSEDFDNFIDERPHQTVGLDGNNVDKDIETVAYAKNAFDYRTSLSFLTASIKHVRKAIKGEL